MDNLVASYRVVVIRVSIKNIRDLRRRQNFLSLQVLTKLIDVFIRVMHGYCESLLIWKRLRKALLAELGVRNQKLIYAIVEHK